MTLSGRKRVNPNISNCKSQLELQLNEKLISRVTVFFFGKFLLSYERSLKPEFAARKKMHSKFPSGSAECREPAAFQTLQPSFPAALYFAKLEAPCRGLANKYALQRPRRTGSLPK